MAVSRRTDNKDWNEVLFAEIHARADDYFESHPKAESEPEPSYVTAEVLHEGRWLCWQAGTFEIDEKKYADFQAEVLGWFERKPHSLARGEFQRIKGSFMGAFRDLCVLIQQASRSRKKKQLVAV